MGWVGVLFYIDNMDKMPKNLGVVHSQLPINISMYYPILQHRPLAVYCFYLVYYKLQETIMKIYEPTIIESELKIKSTASLREEIIKELTQPDKSLSLLLLGNIDEIKSNEPDCDREGDTARK